MRKEGRQTEAPAIVRIAVTIHELWSTTRRPGVPDRTLSRDYPRIEP